MSRSLLASAVAVAITFSSAATAQAPYRTEWDDFKGPFTVGEADSKWFYLVFGPYVADDGIAQTRGGQLSVVSSGTNAETGAPAFTKTIGQDSDNGGLPGGLDHAKWLVYMNHFSSNGYPGFDAVEGQRLACEATIGGRTYGTEDHPFPRNLVDDPNDDLRLAAFALNTVDFETFMVFDFFITNETIYAFYERLPFGQTPDNYYASFSHQIPVAKRNPNQKHKLKIEYDRAEGTVRWYVNNKVVFKVDRLGFLLDRKYLTLDHGGVQQPVVMNQLNCGMGHFTLLDAYRPTDVGLVKLGDVVGYYDPDVGEPVPEQFYDEESELENRLWGQGAKITVKDYYISSTPRPTKHNHGHGGDCDASH